MNKKADMALMLGFIGAVVLVISSGYIFLTFTNKEEKIIGEVNVLEEKINRDYENINSYAVLFARRSIECSDCKSDETKERYREVYYRLLQDLKPSIETNFFSKIEKGDFNFDKTGDNYRLDFKEIKLRVNTSRGTIIRTFNIEISFDKEGNRI